MKLVRQAKLFFREGNSDKVYEIDLCDIGNDRYVVNFRYGRRGAALKEGTKTEIGVDKARAETIFNNLQEEKTGKGYILSDGEALPVTAPAAITATPVFDAVDWTTMPEGREKAVLRRLQDALDGKTNTKIPWKLSRIMWMAGVLQLKEAVPYIYQLALKGDSMQQYAAAWALGRIGDTQAIPLLQVLANSSTATVKRIAGDALLQLSSGEEKEKMIRHHLNSLTEPFKLAITENDAVKLEKLLAERVLQQKQPDYPVLEHLYAISLQEKWLREPLKQLLAKLPARPGYFKHIRHIFKLAEFRDDFEILGVLTLKFEREPEMFSSNITYAGQRTYVTELSDFFNVKEELKKKTSVLAYSNKTRNYFRKRINRNLTNTGVYGNVNYVRMATGILLAYDKQDHKPSYSSNNYIWQNGRYQTVITQFPANAHATLLHQIISGNDPAYLLGNDNTWQLINPDDRKKIKRVQSAPVNEPGLFKKIISLFGSKKKETPQPEPVKEPETIQHATPFIHLWNQLPQAYIQLLVNGRMGELHRFALENLQKHPDYEAIRTKIDNQVLSLLLRSEFDQPADYGFTLAKERYNPHAPDFGLVNAVLASRIVAARDLARQWIAVNPRVFFEDTEWVVNALFNPYKDARNWIAMLMEQQLYTPAQAELICGRIITRAITLRDNNAENNEALDDASAAIRKLFADKLRAIGNSVVEDLVKSPIDGAKLLGLHILLLKKDTVNYDDIPVSVFIRLLENESAAVRETTAHLLLNLSVDELLKRQELVAACTVSGFSNIRVAVRPVLQKMIDRDAAFGSNMVELLIPYLLRKEVSEGLHKDISETLQTVLLAHVKNADKAMVLKLVYSDYMPTQEFGIAVLNKYVDPDTFTLRQIIGLGNHETLLVREWSWQYFTSHVARIKYERDEAIRLLDATWEDTREFAKTFFEQQFTEADWSPETLIALADSVRPDVEAYGRLLITKFFTDEAGEEYLIKLSQHPSIKMQLFATNYLERFAADNPERLEQLGFYFRSVLSRVNQARTAKNRIFKFLLAEGKKTEQSARMVVQLITDISATVAIDDKAKCIEILHSLKNLYHVEVPMVLKPVSVK